MKSVEKRLAVFYLLFSLQLFILTGTIYFTGYSIYQDFSYKINLLQIVAITFIFISVILFVSSTGLDALIIPSQASEKRTREKARRAADYYHHHQVGVLVASGGKTPGLNPKYNSDAEIIFEELVKAGVPRDKIILEDKSRDNLENVLYSLKKTSGTEIGIVSYPRHLDRFEYIIEKGKEQGVIDSRIKIHRVETNQKLIEQAYEIPAGIITRRAMKRGINSAKIPEGWMKKVANYVMKLFSD